MATVYERLALTALDMALCENMGVPVLTSIQRHVLATTLARVIWAIEHGAQNQREMADFVRYTPISWDCLTSTKDGRWISTSVLRAVDVQP